MEKNLAAVVEYMAWADEQFEAYNEALIEAAEAEVEYLKLNRIFNNAYDEWYALGQVVADSQAAADQIAALEDYIEDCTEEIAELEQEKIDAADFTTYEDAVAYWTKIVELDEAYVAACKVDADAKKAAFEAASATPAE